MKVLIVGGVAAGMSAASKLRREDSLAEITVFEQGIDVSYGACGLPYFISGENKEADLMRIRKVEEFREKYRLDVRIRHQVLSVQPSAKTVLVKNLDTGQEYSVDYDKLVLASGASPIRPSLKGINLENIVTLKTIQDAESIRQVLLTDKIRDVAIIGSGFIGLEMVEACVRLGKKVRIFEMLEQVLPAYEPEIAISLQATMEKHGVAIHTAEKVIEFRGNDTVSSIYTDKGEYKTDLVVLSVGVKPNTGFVSGLGLELLGNGAIIVNNRMETNIIDIYAGGDCASVFHRVLRKPVYLPLGTNANKQGKIIGDNLAGKNKEFPGALGTSVLRVLDMEAGKTGVSEKEARANHIKYRTVVVEANNHAPYYPNPQPIKVKLVYDPETRVILGACMAGVEGVALRVNTFAAMIAAGMTLEEAGNLDLCYAPPFSQVWDVIHVAANAANK